MCLYVWKKTRRQYEQQTRLVCRLTDRQLWRPVFSRVTNTSLQAWNSQGCQNFTPVRALPTTNKTVFSLQKCIFFSLNSLLDERVLDKQGFSVVTNIKILIG